MAINHVLGFYLYLCTNAKILHNPPHRLPAARIGKNALAFQVVQTNIVSHETDAKKAVAVVANFLSVFEEGMLQPATGLVHSASHSVRTITLGNANLNSPSLNKINRHALFHYLTTPLSEVKPSTGLHIFLCVLLI